jgi:hypothetical protein
MGLNLTVVSFCFAVRRSFLFDAHGKLSHGRDAYAEADLGRDGFSVVMSLESW